MWVRARSTEVAAPSIPLHEIQKLYGGFYLTDPVGNNRGEFSSRRQRRLYIPPLMAGSPADLAVGERIAYVEVEGGREQAYPGLRNFIYYRRGDQDVFIFDNHNHAFFFWLAAYQAGKISSGNWLVHIDRHSDMWPPAQPPTFSLNRPLDLRQVFEYTNRVLTIATFIKPALQLGLFTEVELLNGVYPPTLRAGQGFVLDIDVDIFADDPPDSPAYRFKMNRFRQYMACASLVTIATSPGFIPQARAVAAVQHLLKTEPAMRRRSFRKSA